MLLNQYRELCLLLCIAAVLWKWHLAQWLVINCFLNQWQYVSQYLSLSSVNQACQLHFPILLLWSSEQNKAGKLSCTPCVLLAAAVACSMGTAGQAWEVLTVNSAGSDMGVHSLGRKENRARSGYYRWLHWFFQLLKNTIDTSHETEIWQSP